MTCPITADRDEWRGAAIKPVAPRRQWTAINPRKVARECSEAHIAFLIEDAIADICTLSNREVELKVIADFNASFNRDLLAEHGAMRIEAYAMFKLIQDALEIINDQMPGEFHEWEADARTLLARAHTATDAGGE